MNPQRPKAALIRLSQNGKDRPSYLASSDREVDKELSLGGENLEKPG